MIAPPDPDIRGTADVRVLFEAARRRRRRRRRLAAGVVCVLLAGAAGVGLAIGRPGGHMTAVHSGPGAAPASRLPRVTLPRASVAWLDYAGGLHVGDVATLAQRVVAASPALTRPGTLLQAGGYLYAGGDGVILRLDPATGEVRRVARGDTVFAAPGGRILYIPRTSASLVELATGGATAATRLLQVPAGWYVEPPEAAVAGGIVLDSHAASPAGLPGALAIWNPATGRVRVVDRGGAIALDSYTPPGATYSLLAWQPANCLLGNCPIEITNTASLTTLTVRSPFRHGFITSGASFSAGGTELAVFARTASLSSVGANISVLALVNTGTGAIRMVPGARLDTPEDAAWILWLPGGDRLLAGALSYSYAVDAATYAARPFFFFPRSADHDIMNTPDINFSVVLLPGRS